MATGVQTGINDRGGLIGATSVVGQSIHVVHAAFEFLIYLVRYIALIDE